MGGGHCGNEELGSVGVGSAVGHAEKTRLVMLQLEVLIGELAAVDRLASAAITSGEVASLEHEVGDHTVEKAALIVQRLALGVLASSHLACTEL